MSATTNNTPSPDEILEQLHYSYISLITESNVPLWYLDYYYDSIGDEAIDRNRVVQKNSDTPAESLPF